MLHKLKDNGLIRYEPYVPVTLTKLLGIVLVSDKVAAEDACKMEHILQPETVEQLGKFVEFVETAPDYPKWLTHFKEYCATGKHECGKSR
jgi:DtxR family Mn-dependent transcriptional regulator